jgi:RES domain-containing protein
LIDAGYLTDILRTLGRPTRGSLFRSIPLKFVSTPLSAIGSVRDGGRYNPQGGFEVLYAADSEEAVLREMRAVVADPDTGLAVPQRHPPKVHFTVNLDLQFMVDLTDATNCDALGIQSGRFSKRVADVPSCIQDAADARHRRCRPSR